MSKEPTNGKEKLHEALTLANSAVKEMGGDTKALLLEDYVHLKKAFADTNVVKSLANAKDYTVTKAKEVGAQVDEHVHNKPYHYIAGAALIGLTLGVLIGRNK